MGAQCLTRFLRANLGLIPTSIDGRTSRNSQKRAISVACWKGGRMSALTQSNRKQKTTPSNTPPWLIRETTADGSLCWFVRLPFSEHAIGEPHYFGPFCHEATARKFETEAYNTVLGAVSECVNIASDLHRDELKLPDGDLAWIGRPDP